MTPYTILREAHSGIRWIVVLLLLVVLIKSLVSWLSKSDYTRLDRQLWLGLVNAMGIQLLLGLILIVWSMFLVGMVGRFWEHAIVNIVAVGGIMYGARFKNLEDIPRHRNTFILVLVVCVLIYFGVARVGGWVL